MDLEAALNAALEFRMSDPDKAGRQLRQAQYFLSNDGIRFAPANRCLSYINGIVFSVPAPSGREIGQIYAALSDGGFYPIAEGHPRFDALIAALDADCRSFDSGRKLGRHGANASSGKVIWLPMPKRADIHQAFVQYDTRGAPEHFREPVDWHVAKPDSAQSYPAKIIWGIATGLGGSDFTSQQATRYLEKLGFDCAKLTASDASPLREGKRKTSTNTVYERNPVARRLCIDATLRANKGRLPCSACDLDFAEVYGEMGAGFIHVHHIVPLAETKSERTINHAKGLVTVCPNCHAMIHRTRETRSIAVIKSALSREPEA